jgi:hypothetical protein
MKQVKAAFEKNVAMLDSYFMSLPWNDKEFYAKYLAQTYYYIIHSTKLLKFAADHSKNPELTECLLHHVSEENGHEFWALGDLKKLGYKIEAFPEETSTKDVYGAIYRGIETYGPAAIVGYAIALEGMSAKVCPQLAPILIEKYGLKCSTFIKNHGEIDKGHSEESFKILKFFTPQEMNTIAEFIGSSSQGYLKLLQNLSKRHAQTA